MIYAPREKKPQLRYVNGGDPRVQAGSFGFDRLLQCLCEAGSRANLAQQSKAERDCLLLGGKEGWRLDAEAFGARLEADRIDGGNEHDVLFDVDSQRVIKVTLSTTSYGAQGSPCAYLTNLSRCNRFFGDAIRFEGMVFREDTGGGDALVISQPFIVGGKAEEEEIRVFFQDMGFSTAGPHAFERSIEGRHYVVADARPDNVLKSASGLVCPIDVQITVSGHSP